MVEKLHEYEGLLGRAHGCRDYLKDCWESCQEHRRSGIVQKLRRGLVFSNRKEVGDEDFSHVYR